MLGQRFNKKKIIYIPQILRCPCLGILEKGVQSKSQVLRHTRSLLSCQFYRHRSPYSSVVERQSCKLKVRSSILRGGISFPFFASRVFFTVPCLTLFSYTETALLFFHLRIFVEFRLEASPARWCENKHS